jgi:hypothetical protein
MYMTGTRFVVKLVIKLGDYQFDPGLKGTILGSVNKMVGKAYRVRFDDGREAELHVVTMNNQTRVITEDGKEIDVRAVMKGQDG